VDTYPDPDQFDKRCPNIAEFIFSQMIPDKYVNQSISIPPTVALTRNKRHERPRWGIVVGDGIEGARKV